MDRNISEAGKRQPDQWKPRAALLELAHDATIAWADKTGDILYWSEGASELYGWNAEQALGQPIHEFLKTVFPQPLSTIEIELYRNRQWRGELVHSRSDGSGITVASMWALQREPQAEAFTVVQTNRDVTRQKQVEEDLRNVRDRTNLASSIARVGTWTWTVRENAFSSDDWLPALFGMPRGTKVTALEHLMSRIQSDDLPGVQDRLAQLLRPDSFAAEFRVVWPNDDQRTLASRAQVTFDGDEAVEVTGYSWDIAAGAEVSNSFHHALGDSRIGAWTWDIRNDMVSTDDYVPVLFGLPAKARTAGLDFFMSMVLPEDRPQLRAKIAAALDIRNHEVEFRVLWPGGSTHVLAARAETRFESGSPVRITGVCKDISNRRAGEMALLLSNAKLREIEKIAHVGDWEFAPATGEIRWSDEIYRIFGLDPEGPGITYERCLSMISAEDRPAFLDNIEQTIRTGEPFCSMLHITREDGSLGYIEHRGRIQSRNNIHEEIKLQGTILDVTEIKKPGQQHFDDLIEAAPNVMIMVGGDGLIAMVNRQAETLFGYDRRDLVGQPVEMLLPERFRSNHAGLRHGFFAAPSTRAMGAGRELFALRKDGSEVPVEIGLNAVNTADGHFAMASIIDITERKKNQERFQLVVEAAPSAMIMVGPDGLITLVNKQTEKLFGYHRDELLGGSVDILLPERFRSNHAALRRGFFAAPSTRAMGAGRDLFGVRKDGAEIPVEIGLNPIDTADGQFVLASIIDITERKYLWDRLERSYRELQDFASVASHDLQEPLRKVQAFGDRLKTLCAGALEGQGEDYLNRMLNAVSRMELLIKDLLTFSQIGDGTTFVDVDLADVTREVLSDLESRITETGATVDLGYLPIIRADPLQMRQLLQNLVGNALKFHKKDQSPTVRIRSEDVDAARGAGGLLRILVEDDGIGFDEKYLNRIFTMFQRLHGRSEYQGTGIGLAICKKIAERHGGSISATSTPGQGAVFAVELPKTHPIGHGGAAVRPSATTNEPKPD